METKGENSTSKRETALAYAKEGWPVLPLNGKVPRTKHGYKDATTDEAQIKKWWRLWPNANIGVVTGEKSGLLVLDIDIKNGKRGEESLQELEKEYGLLPKTLKAQTASRGWHFIFSMPTGGVKGGKDVRDGIDLLAKGSYFVAPPSTIEGRSYRWIEKFEPAQCPAWVASLQKRSGKAETSNQKIPQLIRELFPVGKECNGEWETCCPFHDEHNPSFYVRLNDGVFFCHACGEKGSFAKLYAKIKNISEHEARRLLAPIPTYIEELNKEHAIVKLGGKCVILNEEPHPTEKWKVLSFSFETDFSLQYKNRTVRIGDTKVGIAKVWLGHPARRTYRGADNAPPPMILRSDYYNFWQGFAVEPKPGDCHLYLEHIYDNICQKDAKLYTYVLTWMAQAVQEPGLRPGVALVLQGKQATGKGCMVTEFGKLWGPSFFHAHDHRHLTGNFNGHLRNIMILFADEAFWAGKKAAEGALKALITEELLPIEFKGKDVIQVRNYVRVMMATNNTWAVPAGLEERRFCVIQVGDTRMNDELYFGAIKKEMNNEGGPALLDYLLKYDISKVKLRKIPQTEALIVNKLLSLDPPSQFWYAILLRGNIWGSEWMPRIKKESLYEAYLLYAKEERWKGSQTAFWIAIKKLCPHGKDVHMHGDRCWDVGDWHRCKDAFDRAMHWEDHIWDPPEIETDIPPIAPPLPPSKPIKLEGELDWEQFRTEDESIGGEASAIV